MLKFIEYMNVESFFFDFYFFLSKHKKKISTCYETRHFLSTTTIPLKIAVSSLIEHADFFFWITVAEESIG